MIIKLTGYRYVDYKNSEGRQINGAEVYGVVQDANDKIVGNETFRQYVPNCDITGLVPDEIYEVVFDVEIWNGKPTAKVTGFMPLT